MENTDTVHITDTGVVEAAGYKVGEVHHRFRIVSSVQCEHDGRQHGQVSGGKQQGGREQAGPVCPKKEKEFGTVLQWFDKQWPYNSNTFTSREHYSTTQVTVAPTITPSR